MISRKYTRSRDLYKTTITFDRNCCFVTLHDWDQILDHASYDKIIKTKNNVIGMQIDGDSTRESCTSCIQGKAKRRTFNRSLKK